MPPQVDPSVILRFYRGLPARPKMKLPFPLRAMTLTNTATGIGDTVVLTALSRPAAREQVEVSSHLSTATFTELMQFNPHYRYDVRPFWVAADRLSAAYDLGNGHFLQRLQRAYGFEPETRPRGCLVVPDAAVARGRVALHFQPGQHAAWQRVHIHPRAREVYPENLAVIETFMKRHPEMQFGEVGRRFSGLEGVEDWTGCSLADTIRRLATCEYFLGILSGPLHIATALGMRVVTIVNFPPAEHIMLPVLKDIDLVESDWLYPQNVVLHQDGSGPLVERFSLRSLERSFAGEAYPYWSDRYLPLIAESSG
jgi:hypothetical protein